MPSSETNALFPLNWQYLQTVNVSDQKSKTDYLFTDFATQLKQEADQGGYGSLLKLAFEQVADSQNSIVMIYR